MTNEEKSELRNAIYRLKTVGYSKEWIINNIEKRFGFKKATIRKYWKAVNKEHSDNRRKTNEKI